MVARDATTFEYYPSPSSYVEILHVSATVQQSSSGGPWLNRRGQVVGLQSGVMSLNATPVGVAYLSPLPALRNLLRTRRHAATATLGAAIEETWQQNQDYLKRLPAGTEGLVVKVLDQDGPGTKAGLRQWDVITQAAGQRMRLPDELLRLIRRMKPSDLLELTVLRPDGAGEARCSVTLGKLEPAWP
jgi:S1-C subfamily serine protease